MIDNDIILWKEKVQREIAEESGYNLAEQIRKNEDLVNKMEAELGLNSLLSSK